MRKSSIQVMRKTRINSLDQSTTLNQGVSYQKFQTSKLVRRLTHKKITKVASQKILYKFLSDHVIQQPNAPFGSSKIIEGAFNLKTPEYTLLKNKQLVQTDPFLRAKIRYLEAKEMANLIKQMPKVKILQAHKKNISCLEDQKSEFTTLKKEFAKQNNKKLYLLTVASSKQVQVNRQLIYYNSTTTQ